MGAGCRDPRSYFGITHAVLHDGPEPPPADLAHLRVLFAGPQPQSLADVAERYQGAVAQAAHAWTEDHATDEQVRWLDAFLRGPVDQHRAAGTPLALLVQEYRALEQLALPQVVPGVADCGAGFDQPVLVCAAIASAPAPPSRSSISRSFPRRANPLLAPAAAGWNWPNASPSTTTHSRPA